MITVNNSAQLAKVKIMLGWSTKDYAINMQSAGIEYMYSVLSLSDEEVDFMCSNEEYWEWWLKHWIDRERKLFVNANVIPGEALAIYKQIHAPEHIAALPDAAEMESTYSIMIGKLNKRLTTK